MHQIDRLPEDLALVTQGWDETCWWSRFTDGTTDYVRRHLKTLRPGTGYPSVIEDYCLGSGVPRTVVYVVTRDADEDGNGGTLGIYRTRAGAQTGIDQHAQDTADDPTDRDDVTREAQRWAIKAYVLTA